MKRYSRDFFFLTPFSVSPCLQQRGSGDKIYLVEGFRNILCCFCSNFNKRELLKFLFIKFFGLILDNFNLSYFTVGINFVVVVAKFYELLFKFFRAFNYFRLIQKEKKKKNKTKKHKPTF